MKMTGISGETDIFVAERLNTVHMSIHFNAIPIKIPKFQNPFENKKGIEKPKQF
jgi:hypothetical protein